MKPTGGKVTPAKPDRAGQPADIISFPTDGRRQASTSAGRFAATDEDFRVLVDGSIEGIVIHRENEVLYINDAFASILGYETAELVALGTVDHIAADHDIDRLLGYRRARLRGEAAPDHYEYQAIARWFAGLVGEFCPGHRLAWCASGEINGDRYHQAEVGRGGSGGE